MFGLPFFLDISGTNLICKTPGNTTQILKAVAMLPSDIIAIMADIKFSFINGLKKYSLYIYIYFLLDHPGQNLML